MREATYDDLREIVMLVEAFHQVPRWPGVAFDAADFAVTATRVIERGVIFLSDWGLIGMLVGPSIYNAKSRIAAEMFFWAPDGRGDALRLAAEAWARQRADVIVMGAHEPGPTVRIARWYARKGYVPMGHQFAKVL